MSSSDVTDLEASLTRVSIDHNHGKTENDADEHLTRHTAKPEGNEGKLVTVINRCVHLDEITPYKIKQLKKINQAVLPIFYNDEFYEKASVCGPLGRFAYYNDAVVGAVCCRVEQYTDVRAMYIMTLGVLPSYRFCGIGTVLLDYIVQLAKTIEGVKHIYLHVMIDNNVALQFYTKHGFTNDRVMKGYYHNSPGDAFLLIKQLC